MTNVSSIECPQPFRCCAQFIERSEFTGWNVFCGDNGWPTLNCVLQQKWLTTCCCDTTNCNGIDSPTFKRALNRQHCHMTTQLASCGKPVSSANNKTMQRCDQEDFACAVQMKDSALFFKCVSDCEDNKCKWMDGGYECCCVGSNCNDHVMAGNVLSGSCTSPPHVTESPGLSGGLIALIVVSSLLAPFIIAIVVIFVVRIYRQHKQNHQDQAQ